METVKFTLSEREIPQRWYNVAADFPTPPAPHRHPGTHQPATADDMRAIFPMGLIEQEVSRERWIEIPDEVRRILALWRPTPLHRARRLEERLGTPARIYYKNESVSPAGSHKPNTAVAQAHFNRVEGIHHLTTETGAGQWGSALAFATTLLGMKCTVYMVRVSFDQKPYRKLMMEAWGAEVHASPSDRTAAGRQILAEHPDTPGSLGIAISEAVEEAATNADRNYALGSVLNHVMLHQTVIGQETKEQLRLAGEKRPDVVIACAGGGSNFAGIAFPFIPDKLRGEPIRLLAVEPAACPTLTKGKFAYDFGDTAKLTPLLKMHTLGHGFIPPSIHSGGLRYHGMSPLVSHALNLGLIEAASHHQTVCFESAMLFARTEGILPAPETSHAIHAAIEEARRAKAEGKERVIVFNLSGHGHFDMAAYGKLFAGELEDYDYPEHAIEEALRDLPVGVGG
jgi:tryptophan synthase beta chain